MPTPAILSITTPAQAMFHLERGEVLALPLAEGGDAYLVRRGDEVVTRYRRGRHGSGSMGVADWSKAESLVTELLRRVEALLVCPGATLTEEDNSALDNLVDWVRRKRKKPKEDS